jgi:gephyrin
MNDALARADVLITTGGSSMGSSDLLKPVIERYLGGTIHFGRVAVKPGKPTTFATIPYADGEGSKPRFVFALPGNPASALVMFYVFVVPALRKLGGWDERSCSLPRVPVQVRGIDCSLSAWLFSFSTHFFVSCIDHGQYGS